MRTASGQIHPDLRTPNGAYESARTYCRTAVAIQKETSGTIEAALAWLNAKGGFGSWLTRLHKGHAVSIHLDHYERLVEMVESMAAERRGQIISIETMANAERGRRHAALTSGRGTAGGGTGVLVSAGDRMAGRG